MKHGGRFIVACILALVPPAAVFAYEATSTSFLNRAPVVDDGGGESSSTNFGLVNTMGDIAAGEATSTSFIVRFGFLPFDAFAPVSMNWRWYGDEENETPQTALAAENVAPADLADQDRAKMRVTVGERASIGLREAKFRLQFSEASDFSAGVITVKESANCIPASLWCYADGGGADGGVMTTRLLSDSVFFGTHNESGITTSSFTHGRDRAVEYEFTIKNAGAASNTAYFFRLFDVVNNAPVPVDAGATRPSIVIGGANLLFAIAGVATSTATEGVVTDVGATSARIAFGELPFDVPMEAAQRLTITTNAAHGYQVFLFQRQDLAGEGVIVPVVATNESPAAWAIPDGAAGAFGYHAGDDTLAGGSTRFAPDNSYARLESDMKEIAFGNGMVNAEVVDVVFKAQISTDQDAGIYETSIVYVAMPVF